MITLFGIPGAASLAPRICLEEAGADYVFVEPDRTPGHAGPPEFVAASPLLQVPGYVDRDVRLSEAAAIVMHIADRFPDSGLAPPVGSDERGDWYRWLVYLTTTPMPVLYQWLYPERFTTGPGTEERVRAYAVSRLDRMFDWIDGELSDRDHLVGGRFTAADAFLWMLCRWTRNMPRPAFSRPNLERFWVQGRARPSIAAVIVKERLG